MYNQRFESTGDGIIQNKETSLWKKTLVAVSATVGILLALNVWTYTPVGEKKVEVCLGKVTGVVLDNGLHAAKPWCSYDLMNFQNQLKTFDNMLLPTQDRMNSFGIVNIKFRLKDGAAVDVRNVFGNEERFFEKTLYADLPNILKSESRKLKDSAYLANDTYVSQLVDGTRERLVLALGDKIDIQEIQLLDVDWDPLVRKQIEDTKKRQEQEKRQLSQLEIQKTIQQEAVEKAKADAQSAAYELQRRTDLAEASYVERTKKADGDLYASQKEAEAIDVRGKALAANPEFINYMAAQATLTEAERWNGERKLTHQIVATPLTTIK